MSSFEPASLSCIHRGNPVPRQRVTQAASACPSGILAQGPGQSFRLPEMGQAVSARFCCAGCEAVHSLLQGRGLGEYYRLRKSAGNLAPRAPAEKTAPTWSVLSDPEFLSEYTEENGRVLRFYLEGAQCAACVWLVEKLPSFAPEVESARLDLSRSLVTVPLREPRSFANVAHELTLLGYRPHPVRQDEGEALREAEDRRLLIRVGVAAAAAGNIMILAVALYGGANGRLGRAFERTSLLLCLPVLFYSAVPFYRSAWGALRKGEASIDLPISLGLLAGGGVSFFHLLRGSGEIYFDTVSSLAFLLLGTRYLLNRVQHRAQAASRLIHFLAPSRARRLEADGTFVEARAEDPRPGDQIEVAPGEAFPVDGKVIAGRGTISTAVLDGESAARLAQPGWQVFAGALNLSSPLRIEVQASGSATRLSRVLEAVQRSLGSRPPIVLFLDRVGRGLVWAVLLLTVLAFGVGASESLAEGFRRAMAMAIIVCPCTFALATPLAFSLALRRAAAVGVLIKSAEAIERLARVRRVFLDKTGTLTAGALEVLSWTPLEPSATTALFFLERPSRHPIARAVERDLRAQLDFEFEAETSASLTDYRETPGAGIEARIGGAHYRVGRLGLSAWKPEEPHHSSEAPLTSVGLWRDGVLAGKLLLGDRIRPDSISIVDKLKKRDLRSSFSRATRRPPSERSRSSRESPIETRSLKPVRKKKAVFCAQAATR